MSAEHLTINGLKLDNQAPTAVSLDRLYTWVIWQFPRPAEGGYYGAVHPPQENHHWYPAIINANKKSVQIYAHLNTQFASPEDAVAYFANQSGHE